MSGCASGVPARALGVPGHVLGVPGRSNMLKEGSLNKMCGV
ncbi:hypothetical protein COLSTE_00528 [Collinsella stercoris DSM 13279]|uniref:Uncharacterized protein n=1 Tax=Collinsella stercoris DSM 13279 TaxID=445975 RepID=B6G8Y7_9ACTN|nr:hypothetical protein COLSTE_00528 [Collinsella stercoris DSM 13279]